MILYIGGAARTGKGILARRLLADFHLPYLSLDVLKMGLTRGMPELAIDPNAGAAPVAERLWPLVREMSASLFRDQVDYVFEGELLPAHVAALRQEHPAQVRACFLGYSAVDPQQKLRDIREYSGYPNDWPQEYGDGDLLAVVRREIAFSQYLEAECARLNLPYFDFSRQFLPVLDEAMAYIRAELRGRAPL